MATSDTEPVKESDGDTRGASMVEKHFQKLQQEKEEAADVKLQELMPLFGQKVRRAALKESDWRPEKAALVLRRFQVARTSQLRHLHKKRKRIFSALAKASHDGEDSLFDSDADGRSCSYSESDSSTISQKKSRKFKRSKKKKDKKKKSKSKEIRKSKDSTKKRRMTEFGKYGVVRESDHASKRTEFVKWAMDVRRIDIESCTKRDEMKLFADFAESFNTGTLPHAKYYDLASYHHKKEVKKSKKKKDAVNKDYSLKDEDERLKEKAQKRIEDHNRRIQEAYYELKTSEKASEMKQQELLRMQMKLAYKTGDTFTASKIATRLKPDDPSDPGKTDLPDEEW